VAKSDVGKYIDLVEQLLKQYTNLRDDSGLLYVACVSKIRGKQYIEETSLYNHFKNKDSNMQKVPTISSVVRLSTKIQTENPELRGEHWNNRQEHQKDCKQDLGYLNR